VSRTIWFVVEHEEGRVHRGAAELAAAARGLDAEAVAVVCCPPGTNLPEQVAAHADRVIALESDHFAAYSPDAWAQAIVARAAADSPAAILLPHAPVGRDLGPMLAARLRSGMLSDCIALEWDGGLVGTRSVYRRKLVERERVAGDVPAIATCQRGAFAPAGAGDSGPIERVAADVDPAAIRSRRLALEVADRGEADITAAKVVVAGGRGLGDAEKFALVQELADALGGVMGASRPVVDQGWVAHDRQIGSSGVTVRPKLYFALGISGAVQHVVGMRESDVIVAINKDPRAPIFEFAHYGIADDLFQVVPAIIDEVKRG
jgi:electron transfer flavoprotein alpha subunit